jgi:uncharacterized protein
VILLDTSGILAALFEDQKHHEECAQVLRDAEGPLILSPFVLAESCAVMRRHSKGAEQMFLEEVEHGAYELASFERDDVAAMRQAASKHNIGVGSASLFVLAERYQCRRILTLRNSFSKRFRILPADL